MRLLGGGLELILQGGADENFFPLIKTTPSLLSAI